MRSIPVAIVWEMFRRGRWSLICGFLGANLLPTIIFGGLGRINGFEFDEHGASVIHGCLAQINMFLFGSAILAAQGSPSRLYALPISTSTLVACHMLPAMVFVALEMQVSCQFLNAAFDLNWPLWGPALFAGTMLGVIQATMWLTQKSAWLPVALAIVAGAPGYWYLSRFSLLLIPPSERYLMHSYQWRDVTPVEVVILISLAIVSYSVSVFAVARDRCGEQIQPLGIVAWIGRVLDFDSVFAPPFRSPNEAHFWFEWQKKGWAMPGAVIFGELIMMTIWVFDDRVRDPRKTIEGLVAGGMLLSLPGLIFGLIAGNIGPSDSSYHLGHFLGSRPLTSTSMAQTVLKVIAKSVLIAWLIWLASFVVLSGIMLVSGFAPQPFLPSEIRWWYFPATLLCCWTVAAVVTSLVLTGRTKLIMQLASFLLIAYFGLMILSLVTLSLDVRLQLFRALACAIGIGLVLGSAVIFIAARRQRLIGTPTVAIAMSIWIALSTVVLVEWIRNPLESLPVHISLIGACALAVVPLAAAPLAVSWNRVR